MGLLLAPDVDRSSIVNIDQGSFLQAFSAARGILLGLTAGVLIQRIGTTVEVSRRVQRRSTLLAIFAALALANWWLSYHINWIYQRQNSIFEKDLNMYRAHHVSGEGIKGQPIPTGPMPIGLWLLGDQPIAIVWPRRANDDAEVGRLHSLFPEADVRPYEDAPR